MLLASICLALAILGGIYLAYLYLEGEFADEPVNLGADLRTVELANIIHDTQHNAEGHHNHA